MNMHNYDFLLSDLSSLAGVGKKTSTILRKKKINNIFDLLFNLPQSYTDRRQKLKINEILENLGFFLQKCTFGEKVHFFKI